MKKCFESVREWFGHTVPRRTAAAVCILWLCFMLIPLCLMCFYAHPVYDDFPHILNASAAWAETGSLSETLRAAWSRMLTMYETWQGTFAAMLNSAFQPMVFGPRYFFLTPLCTLLALCGSLACLVNAMRRRFGMNGWSALVLYTLWLTLLLQYMPGMREVIYWQSGIPYTLSFIALFLMAALLVGNREKGAFVIRCILLAGLGIVLGGCPYPAALACAVGFALLLAAVVRRPGRLRTASVICFLSVAVSLAVVVLAPGNAVRQTQVGAAMNPLKAVIMALAECAEFTSEKCSPAVIGACILTFLVLKPYLKDFSFRFPFLVSVFSFGVLAAAFVPPLYAVGVEECRIDRIQASLYMLLVFLLLLNTVWWTGWLESKITAHDFNVSRAAAFVCTALMVWGLFGVGILASPSVSSWKNLLNGSAAAYDRAMTAREQALAAAETAEEQKSAVTEVGFVPEVLPVDKLPGQKDTAMPALMHDYYVLYVGGSEQ